MANDKPVDTIRDGALKATIWRNPSEKGDFYSTTLSRTYKDDEGRYKDSNSFASNDMLRVAELSRKTHDRVIELRRDAARDRNQDQGREHDRGKQPDRGRSPSP